MNRETGNQMAAINSAVSRVNGLYGKWAKKHGINLCVLGILYTLNMEGVITQKQYSEGCMVPKQSVNNVIASLKKDGYISMQTSKTDKREKLIVLTEEGCAYSEALLAPLRQIEGAVVQKMGREFMGRFIDVLISFGGQLEQELEKAEGR